MARYHVLGSKFDSNNEIFTEEDREAIKAFDNFKGFIVNGTLISNIFPEYTDEILDINNYSIPIDIRNDEQQVQAWPIEKTFISSEKKRVTS